MRILNVMMGSFKCSMVEINNILSEFLIIILTSFISIQILTPLYDKQLDTTREKMCSNHI